MAEDIGRKVAQELSDRFARMGMEVLAQQSNVNFQMQTLASLRRSITEELRGFNEVVPARFRLTMLSGQSCLVFTLDTRLALTLKVENTHVRLVPPGPRAGECLGEGDAAAQGRDSAVFMATRSETGYSYRKLSLSPAAYEPILSESEFIEGVIRVACNQRFERP